MKPVTIDEYIADCPEPVRPKLEQIRQIVKKCVPDGQEIISYGMPAIKWNGMLLWFAAHTAHIGIYPKASAINFFQKDLVKYKTSKGAVQFPFDKPLPLALITKIVKFRVKENEMKAKTKKATTKPRK